MQYISSIRPQAEIYGICKIVPPEGWAPPLALDKGSFRFNTVIQAVHRLQDRLSLPAQQAFYEDLKRCMHQEGKAPKKPPMFGGREVDLYKMYRAVAKRGGYAAVTDEKKWKDIVRVLQVGLCWSSSMIFCWSRCLLEHHACGMRSSKALNSSSGSRCSRQLRSPATAHIACRGMPCISEGG